MNIDEIKKLAQIVSGFLVYSPHKCELEDDQNAVNSLIKLLEGIENLNTEMQWQPIETAPKGSGEDGPSDTTHPDYVKPPKILIKHGYGINVGNYDWYYHPGYGHGAHYDQPCWREALSDEPLYEAAYWMPLPQTPKE